MASDITIRALMQIDNLQPEFDNFGILVGPVESVFRSAIEILERKEARQQVRAAIDQLPENYRIVILLRDIEEMDTAETAAMLQCSEGAIKIRLHRARSALKTLLQPLFD